MSKILDKNNVKKSKDISINTLNNMLESLINDGSYPHLKKAELISYWIKDYVKMINFEENFQPSRNIAYKRGNIVKVHFGFNIGAEYGGLHYAIVLDNHNAHNSPVVTVIPLTSSKAGKEIHSNSVDLGNELYRLLKSKAESDIIKLKKERDDMQEIADSVKSLLAIAGSEIYIAENESDQDKYQQHSEEVSKHINSIQELAKEWEKRLIHNNDEIARVRKIADEITQMKEGSIALVNQITTISKIRIYDPRGTYDVLSGISLTKESMNKINQKIKELYVF